MKGYTIQNSINLLEKNATGGGSGGSTSADKVSFDNTDTGLDASNVQNALAEVSSRGNYSTTGHKIGKWIDGSDLYEKTIVTNKTNVAANSSIDVTSEISALGAEKITSYDVRLYYEVAETSPLVSGNYVSVSDLARLLLGSDSSSIKLNIGSATYSKLDIEWTVQYVKTTPPTRKSTKKK